MMNQFDQPGTWLPVLFLAGATLVLLVLLRRYQVRAAPRPETVRKFFHVAGGLLGLSLVWLFDDFMPVLILGAVVAAMFALLRIVPPLRGGVGQVLFAVNRNTVGEFCYVASFVLLFWLAKGNKLLYSVPLVVLAVADSVAALIGRQYGKLRFTGFKSSKTVEGTVGFFVGAFFCVHVPVLLWSDAGRLESLLIALNISVMVMMAEAAAWWGLDNLIIPMTTYLLLDQFLGMGSAELVFHFVFLSGMAAIMYAWRRRTTLSDDALFGSTLWGYVVWVMGGWHWILPPLIVFVAHDTITSPSPLHGRRVFGFPVVLAHITAGLVWLLVYAATGDARYFYPFVAGFAASLSITALVRYCYRNPGASWFEAVTVNALKGAAVFLPAILLFDGFNTTALGNISTSASAVIFAEIVFALTQPRISRYPTDPMRWLRQAAITLVASVVALLPHWILVEAI